MVLDKLIVMVMSATKMVLAMLILILMLTMIHTFDVDNDSHF